MTRKEIDWTVAIEKARRLKSVYWRTDAQFSEMLGISRPNFNRKINWVIPFSKLQARFIENAYRVYMLTTYKDEFWGC